MASSENKFSPSDLLQYAETLIKESLRKSNNYSWSKSRHFMQTTAIKSSKELDKLKRMIQKMTSENCAKIAVKLDTLTVGANSASAILHVFKHLVEEQYIIQLLEYNVKCKKEGKKRINRIHPEKLHTEKLSAVSFIQ